MQKVIRILIIILIVPLLFTSCMDDENSSILPPATSHGANTIGFVIDGQEWTTAERQPLDWGSKFGSYVYGNLLTYFSTGNILSSYIRIEIAFDSLKVDSQVEKIKVSFFKGEDSSNIEYNLQISGDDLKKENYKFRIETESGRRVVYFSWQFDITLTNKDGKTVRLTQGRLDAKGD